MPTECTPAPANKLRKAVLHGIPKRRIAAPLTQLYPYTMVLAPSQELSQR